MSYEVLFGLYMELLEHYTSSGLSFYDKNNFTEIRTSYTKCFEAKKKDAINIIFIGGLFFF